jgi:hypothetical protein
MESSRPIAGTDANSLENLTHFASPRFDADLKLPSTRPSWRNSSAGRHDASNIRAGVLIARFDWAGRWPGTRRTGVRS